MFAGKKVESGIPLNSKKYQSRAPVEWRKKRGLGEGDTVSGDCELIKPAAELIDYQESCKKLICEAQSLLTKVIGTVDFTFSDAHSARYCHIKFSKIPNSTYLIEKAKCLRELGLAICPIQNSKKNFFDIDYKIHFQESLEIIIEKLRLGLSKQTSLNSTLPNIKDAELQNKEMDFSDEEMAESAFGQGSNTAKSFGI